MLIIADKRIPAPALENLRQYGELMLIETKGITYEAVSGHPDIFFSSVNSQLIAAPNLPTEYLQQLDDNGINYVIGEMPVGEKYPETAGYNAVCTENYLFHNFRYTDSVITKLADNLDLVHINQGYARCNLVPLKNNHFITSDEGIFRVLKNYGMEVLLVNPEGILLPGFKHGFIGGAAGIFDDAAFFIGKLAHHPDGNMITEFLTGQEYKIIELYDGPLFDGGSILFIRNSKPQLIGGGDLYFGK